MKRLILLVVMFNATVNASEQNTSEQQKSNQENITELYVRYSTIDNQLIDLERHTTQFPYVTLEQYVFIMQWMEECSPVIDKQRLCSYALSEKKLLLSTKIEKFRNKTVLPLFGHSCVGVQQNVTLQKPDRSEL